MKRKDQLAELRGKQFAQLNADKTRIRAELLNPPESKNVHAKSVERRRLARLQTVKREMEIINHG